MTGSDYAESFHQQAAAIPPWRHMVSLQGQPASLACGLQVRIPVKGHYNKSIAFSVRSLNPKPWALMTLSSPFLRVMCLSLPSS